MSERTEFPTTAHGKLEVTGWIIGVVDAEKDATEIAHAIEATGVPADHLLIEAGTAALRQLQTQQAHQQQGGLLARAFDSVEKAFEGREPARQALESEARQGRTFLGVHMSQDDQLDGVRNTFVEHGAHTVYVFRPTGIGQLA
ncbi:MAG TPA: hypothetical protein VGP82_08630 [Ktedonobacterales bacterium]|jgi:hypothetical protein|nr:hypothetical protein [Ktedonobacterales bacterium]